MSKTKNEIIENSDVDSSDDELELKQVTKSAEKVVISKKPVKEKKTFVIAESSDTESEEEFVPQKKAKEVVKKARKPYTMSDETKKKKAEGMDKVREAKMKKVLERRAEQLALQEEEEEEVRQKLTAKLAKEKKKRTKKVITKLVAEDKKIKKIPKKIIYNSESDSESETEIYEKPVKSRKPKPSAPVEEEEYYQEIPQYHYPTLQYF